MSFGRGFGSGAGSPFPPQSTIFTFPRRSPCRAVGAADDSENIGIKGLCRGAFHSETKIQNYGRVTCHPYGNGSILNGFPPCSFCFRLDNAIPRIEHAISRITSAINLNFCISYLIIIHDIRAIFLKKTASYFICVFLSFFSQTPVFNIVLVRAYVKIAHPPSFTKTRSKVAL